MPPKVNSMAYHGEPPWHGLGQELKDRPTSGEMINAAGLNWNVEMRPIPLPVQHPHHAATSQHASRYQLIRQRRTSSESEIPLGVVGPQYRPLQNLEAFNFFDPIVGRNAAVFETAGALGYGERVWVLARIPGEMHIVGDDCCVRYLLLSNSHTGKGAVAIKFTPIRVVCQNTLILALQNGEKAYTVRHTRHLDHRMTEVQNILALTWNTFATAATLFKSLAAVRINTGRLDQYLDRIYPRTPEERDALLRPLKWHAVTQLFERGDEPNLRPSHTLWGAYNSVIRYEDYRQTTEAGPDRRLNRVWFGAGADLKLRALQQATVLMQQWAD